MSLLMGAGSFCLLLAHGKFFLQPMFWSCIILFKISKVPF